MCAVQACKRTSYVFGFEGMMSESNLAFKQERGEGEKVANGWWWWWWCEAIPIEHCISMFKSF